MPCSGGTPQVTFGVSGTLADGTAFSFPKQTFNETAGRVNIKIPGAIMNPGSGINAQNLYAVVKLTGIWDNGPMLFLNVGIDLCNDVSGRVMCCEEDPQCSTLIDTPGYLVQTASGMDFQLVPGCTVHASVPPNNRPPTAPSLDIANAAKAS